MKNHCRVCDQLIFNCLVVIGFYALLSNAYAKDIGIAFIEDGVEQQGPRLSNQIVRELQPLLDEGDTLVPVFIGAEDVALQAMDSVAQVMADPAVDFIVATGIVGSQSIYQIPQFDKPTYLLRLLDPDLTGIEPRDAVRNLRSYSVSNAIVDVFERLSELFKAKRVAIIIPDTSPIAPSEVTGAVGIAATKAGIDATFISVDLSREVPSALLDVDAVILPPISTLEDERATLFDALRRQKIPSYVVGGNSMVLNGALISDSVDEDERVLARRVALDLQLAISGESRTQGIRKLEPKKSTTINMDTARALGVDFTLDELMSARLVQGNSGVSTLGLLAALELATQRNLGLEGQFQQLQIDQETLEQARAALRPQLSVQIEHNRRGDQLPEQDTLASVSVSQTLYSPSANANAEVAGLGLDASQGELEQTQLDTIQQVATAYFQALQTQAQFESRLRDLTLNRENLSLAERRERSGGGSGADIYRWQATIAASETEVVRAFTANTSAQSQLAQLLNTRLQVPSTLADVELDQPPFDLLHEEIVPFLNSTGRVEILRQASASRAIENSPMLDTATADVAINSSLLQATRRSYYIPELSLGAQYGYYLDSTVNMSGVELDDEGDWSLSVTARLPLWLGGNRRSLIRQYAAQRALANTRLKGVRIALWASSTDAVNNLVSNYRAIGLSQQSEEAALKSQQITQNAYRLGAATVTELLDTQTSYLEAQNNVHIARYQYLTALVDFQVLMGEIPMLMPAREQQQWLQTFKQRMLEGATQ